MSAVRSAVAVPLRAWAWPLCKRVTWGAELVCKIIYKKETFGVLGVGDAAPAIRGQGLTSRNPRQRQITLLNAYSCEVVMLFKADSDNFDLLGLEAKYLGSGSPEV